MSEIALNFDLHEKQLEVFKSKARFRVLMAGRRFGKTYLARVELIVAALKTHDDKGRDLKDKAVWYVAPTYGQAKEIMWESLKDAARPVTKKLSEKEMWIELVNGRRIYVKGADNPDALRGRGISDMVIDEFDAMKANIWDLVLMPTLADVGGRALFIGTPAPGGSMKEFYERGQSDEYLEWESWKFKSMDNPTISSKEIEAMRGVMSDAAFRQEMEADPDATSGGALDVSCMRYAPSPAVPGIRVITIDLAGFTDNSSILGTSKTKLRTDESAIACVEITPKGWFVHRILHGHWGVRETALRIINAAQEFRPMVIGIERGALMQAVGPYLDDMMKQYGIFPNVVPLSHGKQAKTDRIIWALQGRLEHGHLVFNEAEDWKEFVKQAQVFPHPYVHDDLLDALAYADQIVTVSHVDPDEFQTSHFEPLDQIAGY